MNQAEQNALCETVLAADFMALGLPDSAAEFLLTLWRASQTLDDVADGDMPSREDTRQLVWAVFVGLPSNQFWRDNHATLQPVVALFVMRWIASDEAELGGRADARSFGWRAGYYDVVLMVACLCLGPQKAMALAETVLGMHKERFEDYAKEFQHA